MIAYQFFVGEDLQVVNQHARLYFNEEQTYIDSDKVNLGVAVLAGFGGGHFDDLARTV